MLRTLLTCALLAAIVEAEETADTSLAHEVDRYLDQTTQADPHQMQVRWKDYVRFETADGAFVIALTGRLQWDTSFRSSDEYVSPVTDDSTYFRRVRLGVSGTIYTNTIFQFEVGFASGEARLQTAFIGLKNLPVVGRFRAGHFDEPFGLGQSTSSRFITFMERSVSTNAFAPGKNAGMELWNAWADQRITGGIGVFRPTDSVGSVQSDDGYAVTLRITGRPIDDGETILVHVGFATSYRTTDDGTVLFGARPGTGNGSRLIDTGDIPADMFMVFGFELMAVWHSFSAQFEAFLADVDSAPSTQFTGWYVEVSWFVTGEARNFVARKAAFGRVRPNHNLYDGSQGWGAVQIAFRFDRTDLNDGTVQGGVQNTYTFGVNWHWNPNVRWMFNVVLADVTGGPVGTGELLVFETRFQFDF